MPSDEAPRFPPPPHRTAKERERAKQVCANICRLLPETDWDWLILQDLNWLEGAAGELTLNQIRQILVRCRNQCSEDEPFPERLSYWEQACYQRSLTAKKTHTP